MVNLFKFYKITKTPIIFSITLFIASLVTWFLFIKLAERGCARGHLPLLLQKSIHFVFGTLRFLKHLLLFLRKLIPFFWNIKIPERWVENDILDSIALYTKKMCTIPALLITQIKHINKRANQITKLIQRSIFEQNYDHSQGLTVIEFQADNHSIKVKALEMKPKRRRPWL